MTISDYITGHWGLLVILMGMAMSLLSDSHLETRIVYRMLVAELMLLLYSISCFAESYFSNLTEFSIHRAILSAVDYSLITFILVVVITIMYPKHKTWLYIPAVMNAALCFISIPTGIVFSFDENNHFHRGPLGYLTYFITGLYLLYLFINLFRNKKVEGEELRFMLYIAGSSAACLIMPLYIEEVANHWLNVTIATNLMLYYLFLLQQYTKRDPLTKLLNRQSYYSDLAKYDKQISALVAIDMNGLKELNDTKGHVAGDTALSVLADCFCNSAAGGQRVYRIGGDEYLILCLNNSEDDVKELTGRIRENVGKTAYSCAVGYAMRTENKSMDEVYNKADAVLYEDKIQFYERTGKSRRKSRN